MEHRNSRCTLCDAEASEIYTLCQCASCHQVRGFHHLPRRPCVRFAHRTKVRFPSWESPSAYVFAEGVSRITPDAPFPLNEMPFSTPNIATTGRMHTPHTQSPGVAETYTSFFLLPFPLASSAPDRNGVFSFPPHPNALLLFPTKTPLSSLWEGVLRKVLRCESSAFSHGPLA